MAVDDGRGAVVEAEVEAFEVVVPDAGFEAGLDAPQLVFVREEESLDFAGRGGFADLTHDVLRSELGEAFGEAVAFGVRACTRELAAVVAQDLAGIPK